MEFFFLAFMICLTYDRYWQNPIISSVLVVLFIGFSLDATHDIQHRSVNGNGLHTNTGLLGGIHD